jgi:protein-tyrosine phosphatase
MRSDERVRSGAILTVCTGNLCRSPVVERLLRIGIASEWPTASSALPVASAGTNAALGRAIPEPFATRLASIGAEASPFAPRQVTRRMLAGAELVITATRAHRATCVELYPPAVHYTFTLRELARLAGVLPPGDQAPLEPLGRLRSFVTAAASARGAHMPGEPAADDVPDPYGGNDARYEQAWNILVDATSEILTALCPAGLTVLSSASTRPT